MAILNSVLYVYQRVFIPMTVGPDIVRKFTGGHHFGGI